MKKFPTKRHYAITALFWVPSLVQTLLDPWTSWAGLAGAAFGSLVVAYVFTWVLTAILRNIVSLGKKIVQ
jgi:hypothetical protein